jgi:peptidoglycan hydrolase-like protein with peptidoglycan-binding domain
MNFRELLNKIDEADTVAPAASNADALAAVNAGGAAPAPMDPSKVYAYRRAQAAMARLEKAAQYTGTDEIVRQRAGLPPPLPPIEQWDGKMPAPIGKPDWINRVLGTGGGATGDTVKDQSAASAENDSFAAGHETALSQLKQLSDLVAKLKPAAPVKESSIAGALLESFGYQLDELDASDAAVAGGAYAAGNAVERGLAGKVAKGAAGAAKTATGAMGKIASKALPGVGAAFGAVDAYDRAKKGDYFGAGIAGLSGALSLVPGIGWMPAVALDMFNLGRDLRGPTASAAQAEKHPVGTGAIAQLQKIIGTEADGIFGPKSQAALKVWQQKNGLEPDGIPGPKTFAAAKLQAPGASKTVAEQISSLQTKIYEAQNPSSLYFILEDGNLYELTPNDEWYVLDEGLAGDAISGLAKYGGKAWDAIKGLGKGVAHGVANPEAVKAYKSAKPGASIGTKAGVAGAKAGGVLARNPVKTALGAGALGYALGNNSGTTAPGGNSGTGTGTTVPGGQSSAEVGTTTDVDPQVIDQIGQLMSNLAQSQDEEVLAQLDVIRNQINQITGGKPLDSLIAKPSGDNPKLGDNTQTPANLPQSGNTNSKW